MKNIFTVRLLALLAVLAIVFSPLGIQSAYAHGHVEVGDYEIVIGWHVEPAYQGEVNGLEFFVTNMVTEEPVTGLEDSLQLAITYGSSTIELPVEAQWGQDGAYIGYAIPTVAGDYTAHIWGDIEGTPVDVSMTSGPETYGTVETKASISFPSAEPSLDELSAKAQNAMTIAIIGLVVGVAGVATGFVALRSKPGSK
jgi:hypothetical protein